MTTSPTARMIADAIEASGKTQREIAEEMGLLRPNVISMLKTGEMTMPIERIPAFSKATGIDPLLLTQTAMSEYMPETWNVLATTAAPIQDVQINIRAPGPVVERFKAICQRERRNYGDMLSILIGVWDGDVEKMV
ncbi:MAG: helix-turn-helix transcriptional regulator [Oceanospirillaceae bacterium]|uniref:helix-turn-helix domain-containing protein n=1 Tax=Salipiger sp. HF18 TaxID=2721557 RepID=UPI00142D951B|nr:helix-turn-helix transcriptional regulator [Salipiger sp. HF18]NIY95450.1 helix-turn-helix transcriptional regulator [Salipiger sp. HF18]NVK43487.1 helix-turn-helix transcriptional regulator [Oceanospirillaceae bacterium]